MNTAVAIAQTFEAVAEAQEFVAVAHAVGLRGERGPSGSAGDSFDYIQGAPASTWDITHSLGRRPIVDVYSAGGVQIVADVLHLSTSQVQITFAAPTAGYARLI